MKVVTYLRVSTKTQKLGIDSQRSICQHFINSDSHELIKEFSEKKSGKNANRPQLLKAIQFCLENDCHLMVAKIDRLARDVEDTFKIMKQLKGKLLSCDIPQLDTLTLGIFASLAQRERELISIRTKAALKVLKDKGVKLGSPQNMTAEGREKGWATNIAKAKENKNNQRALVVIKELRDKGESYRDIAAKLNDNGFVTSRGNSFKPTTVMRLYKAA
jgi:DNA invertase Pin-like site-specific DNA recombinase